MKSSRQKVAAPQPWSVAAFMTSQPVTIGRKESLATAHHMMRANGVRHLPVLEHGELVGIVTQRDLLFLEIIRGVDLDADTVEDAMSTDAYSVPPDAPIAQVAKHMARKRYGCAVIIERGRVRHRCCSTHRMATRSEQFRADTERASSTAKDKPKVEAPPHEKAGHAEKKATYAREEGVALDHRSRKSSRKSANHAKTDATEVHAAQMKESTPQQSFERSAAKASRVRGGGAS